MWFVLAVVSLMFCFNFNTLQWFHNFDELIDALRISYFDPFLTIGRICLKSTPKIITFPPNGLYLFSLHLQRIKSYKLRSKTSKRYLFIIGTSSQIINLVSIRSFARRLPWAIIHVDSSVINNGIEKVEWVVLPPRRSKLAIPLDATFNTIFFWALVVANNIFQRKVFPIPP